MLQCINGKMKYRTNTNLETLNLYIYICIYIYETKHNIKKLIVMDILTSWKQNGEKINK